MPRAHIVLAHPEPQSYNAHLARTAQQALEAGGWTVSLADLYAQGFDPCEGPRHFPEPLRPERFDAQTEQRHASEKGNLPAEVAAEIANLEAADLLILQFPLWWHMPPAMLKGWLDRVFVYGRLYTSRLRYDTGHFKGRRAMLSVTCGGPEATFAHNGRNGDIDLLLWPTNYSLAYMGYTVLAPFVVCGVEGGLRYSPETEVAARLARAERALAGRLGALEAVPAIPFSGWADWDASGRLKPGVAGHSPFMRAVR